MDLGTVVAVLAKFYLILTQWNGDQETIANNQSCSSAADSEPQVKPPPYTIIVEGNTGSGKSTFTEYFDTIDGFQRLSEPIDQWQNVNGTNLHKLMIEEPERWSGTFQMESTLTRLQQCLKVLEPEVKVRIMERSLFSERYCFLEWAHRKGQISDPEFSLMDRWFRIATIRFWTMIKPDMIVYIRTGLENVRKRVKERNREGESHFDAPLLADLQRLHEDWLHNENSTFPVPTSNIVVVDGDKVLEDMVGDGARKLLQRLPASVGIRKDEVLKKVLDKVLSRKVSNLVSQANFPFSSQKT